MLRLTVLLCVAMFVTLLIAGEDRGQMRPRLAAAVAQGAHVVLEERRVTAVAPASDADQATTASAAIVQTAAFTGAPAASPSVRGVTPAPVFTLSSLPTVTVDPPAAEAPVAEAAVADAAPEGEVWYVAAKSVNVRQGPSRAAPVMDRLTRGEAVSVSFEEGSEWAQVLIEGDGTVGYVALSLLSPVAP